MRAAVSTGIGEIEIREVETPVPGPGEALIKVHYCGICGSDLHGFQQGDPFAPFPHIFGHEASGKIMALGSPTDALQSGDRVVYEITLGCGSCRACREGRGSDCGNVKIIGGHLPGAFAEYVKVPYQNIYKVPNDMPFRLAAVCEPYTVAARGCARGEAGPGDTVLVLGAGSIALCAVAIAKERGARVLVAARNAPRLARAADFGPDVCINTGEEDLLARVMELTAGEGCEVVIEATGAKAVIEDAGRYVTRGGRLVILGISGENVCFSAYNILTKEMKIIGSQNSYGQYPRVIDALSRGKLHGDKYVTDVYPFERAAEAFRYAIDNAGRCGKVLLAFVPDEDERIEP